MFSLKSLYLLCVDSFRKICLTSGYQISYTEARPASILACQSCSMQCRTRTSTTREIDLGTRCLLLIFHPVDLWSVLLASGVIDIRTKRTRKNTADGAESTQACWEKEPSDVIQYDPRKASNETQAITWKMRSGPPALVSQERARRESTTLLKRNTSNMCGESLNKLHPA